MLAHRIIPCLDVDLGSPEGRVVKGVQFKQIRSAGVPWELAARYYHEGADEIVFLDITASHERRGTMVEVVKRTCQSVFIPITVGGGIKTVEDAKKLFSAGADKVSVNTSAVRNPELLKKLRSVFGSQAVVLAIDAERRYEVRNDKICVETPEGTCWFECSIYGGRTFTGIDAIAWAQKAAMLGAGEILLTSMDRDGTKKGFDLQLTRAISEAVPIPVVASGGAGTREHFADVFEAGRADAALAASLFHFQELSIIELKQYLASKKIGVRV